MRNIKFRGKDKKGKWYFGDLSRNEDSFFITSTGLSLSKQVDPQTIGQLTDLQDINGLDIYEGDIIWNPKSKEIYEVAMIDGAFRVLEDGFKGEDLYWTLGHGDFKVIGNIHDDQIFKTEEEYENAKQKLIDDFDRGVFKRQIEIASILKQSKWINKT